MSDNIYVVSGAGIYNETTHLGAGDDTLIAGDYAGFVLIDLLKDNRIKFTVIKVINFNGDTDTNFTMWLEQ